ncbi:MAG: hypothetical protein J6V72_05560 [Kiritimatiellae bacterium]|nr:hypothetical protein [Kiritimatiellia bacterium]
MSFPEIIETIRVGLMKAGLGTLALIVGGGVLFALWRTVRRPLVTTWRLLGWSGKTVVTILCAVCIFLAGGKNEGLRGTGNLSVTPEEIAQGYRLESVVTNDAASYSIPTDGVEYARWSIRGGRETRFALDLGDFYFPFGTGVVHRFDVLSGGRIESLPRPSLVTICAAREWASLVPGEGRFWWADAAVVGRPPYQGTQAVKLLTWEGVYAGRDRTGQYNAQIELRSGGDFTTRSNNVECVYRRVPPFDWDDDGLENSVDPDPLVAGPDAHGTNAEWYNTVCSNIVVATRAPLSGGGPPLEGPPGGSGVSPLHLEWLENVNSNAYYFVDVVTEHGPAPIYFTGDRDSRLGNPVVVARAGETNHVPLLIGVSYAVTSTVPFMVSVPDEYMYPEVQANEPCVATICWPLNFVFTESIGASNRVYTVTVEPYDPGGVLEWDSNVPMRGTPSDGDCGCVHCSGYSASFTCSSTCTCGAGCSARGTYHLERGFFSVEGGQCRCGFDDPPPDDPTSSQHMPNDPLSLTITFSKQAVIFEDSFLERPGLTRPRRSTRVRLTVDAYGGSVGGTLALSGVNVGKLFAVTGGVTLPYSNELAPGETYHATGVYEGVVASDGADDVVVSGTLTPTYSAYSTLSAEANLTSVKVALTAEYVARDNPSQSRHTYGVGEKVHLAAIPALESITYRAVKSDVSDAVTPYDTVRNGDISGMVSEVDASQERIYICPAVSTTPDVTVSFAAVKYRPAMTVVEPSEIVSPAAFWTGDFWPTQVGFGCMSITNYIGPFHVSFKGVMVAEIPCNEAIPPTGFFASTDYTGELTHNFNAGAGWRHNIKQDNFWRQDDAGRNDVIDHWDSGVLTWKIPIGWKRFLYEDQEARGPTYECDYESYTNKLSRPLLIGGRTDAYIQTFRIDSDGTTTIEKFGWRMTRSPWSFSGTVEKTE